jgi:hypothetical protein
MTKTKPTITCRKVDDVNTDDWKTVDALFKDADFAHFQQGWTDQPTQGFRPAKAAAAWTGASLIIYAELCDDDIYNTMPESDFNNMAINHGDVFEIFLQPAGQAAYYEIHIAPNNHKFQLRIPCLNAFQKMKSQFNSGEEMTRAFKVWKPVVDSRVRIDAAARKWWVVVKIPLSMLAENVPAAPGAKWLFSFCRYDYTRPGKEPTYSSTSPHSAINYHLVHEYGTMEFYP